MSDIRPAKPWPRGTVKLLRHESSVLQGNPWNDPSERDLAVYLPAGYSERESAYIALWDLAAYTNSGLGHVSWRNHGENLPERLDRLIAEQLIEPVVVVFPDCYTALGGNQYVNSAAVGSYSDYLVDELIPFVEEHVNVISGRDGRGLFGKSSGGYGSLYQAMVNPQHWGAVASHAGDVGFDLLFRPEMPTASGLLQSYGGDHNAFIRAFWRKKRPNGRDFTTMMMLAMAASYDPDEKEPGAIQLPFDLYTCELDEERWSSWLAYDPLSLIEQHADALNDLHGLFIDVGMYDQYNIQYGSRRLTRRLRELGVEHHYEEFEGTHSSIDWRLDTSLPFLVNALKSAAVDAT